MALSATSNHPVPNPFLGTQPTTYTRLNKTAAQRVGPKPNPPLGPSTSIWGPTQVRVFWDWPVEVADKITGYEITTVPATVTQTAPPDTAWYDFFYVTFTKSVSYLFYVASVNKNGKSAPVPDYGPIIPNP